MRCRQTLVLGVTKEGKAVVTKGSRSHDRNLSLEMRTGVIRREGTRKEFNLKETESREQMRAGLEPVRGTSRKVAVLYGCSDIELSPSWDRRTVHGSESR
jgi:hypothetical protein